MITWGMTLMTVLLELRRWVMVRTLKLIFALAILLLIITFVFSVTICDLESKLDDLEERVTQIEEEQAQLIVEVTPEPTPEPSDELSDTSIDVYFPLTDDERRTVECMVMGEAGNQSLEGQMAVAQCILNACVGDDLRPSEVRGIYQYSGWSDHPSNRAQMAVERVFDDGYKVVDENILWFYNPAISEGRFHNTQKFVIEIGDHRFYAPWE